MDPVKIHCNVDNHMIPDDEWEIINTRMKDKKFSTSCFLAECETAQQVIAMDQAYLSSVGITRIQIADALQTLVNIYDKIQLTKQDGYLGNNLVKYNNLFIKCDVYYGAQICPFQNINLDNEYHGWSYGNRNIFISYKNPYEYPMEGFSFNTLLIHMIRNHGFFEGLNQQHRLHPKTTIETLNLQPGVDYCNMNKDYIWCNWNKCSFVPFAAYEGEVDNIKFQIVSKKLSEMLHHIKINNCNSFEELYKIAIIKRKEANQRFLDEMIMFNIDPNAYNNSLDTDIFTYQEILEEHLIIQNAVKNNKKCDLVGCAVLITKTNKPNNIKFLGCNLDISFAKTYQLYEI